MTYKEPPREILVEIGNRWASSGKWYNSNERDLLFWLSMYSLAVKPKVILSSLISELSDATPISTTDKKDLGRSSSLRLSTYISDATI